MTLLFILFTLLDLVILYTIINEFIKRKKLGKILMKVKANMTGYILIAVFSIIGISNILLIILAANRISTSELYNIEMFRVDLSMFITYLLISILYVLRIVKGREIRENGLTLVKRIVKYKDLKGLVWLSANNLKIIFVRNNLDRQYSEKWNVNDNQINELKKILKKKYK